MVLVLGLVEIHVEHITNMIRFIFSEVVRSTKFTMHSLRLYSHDPCLWVCGRTLEHTYRGFVAPLCRRRARPWGAGGAAAEV